MWKFDKNLNFLSFFGFRNVNVSSARRITQIHFQSTRQNSRDSGEHLPDVRQVLAFVSLTRVHPFRKNFKLTLF